MTDLDTITRWLDQQEALCEAATPGPMEVVERDPYDSGEVEYSWRNPDLDTQEEQYRGDLSLIERREDAEFYAQSRTALPQAVRVLRLLVEAAKSQDHDDKGASARCPLCCALVEAARTLGGEEDDAAQV